MKNLYIDFDGVIMDTITPIYELAKSQNIDVKKDIEKVKRLYSDADWEELVNNSKLLKDSLNEIKKLKESGKFNISILTHVNSLKEAKSKIMFINRVFNDLTIIPVPKSISKTLMTETKGAILVDDFNGNLKEWEDDGGIGVKFTLEKEDSKYINITSLSELMEIF